MPRLCCLLIIVFLSAFFSGLGCDRSGSEPAKKSTPPEKPFSPATSPQSLLENDEHELIHYATAQGVEYLEIISGAVDPQTPLPMIVAIHGLGDRPEHFASLLQGFPVASRIILPRALDPYEDGFSWFPLRARSKDVEGLSAGIRTATDKLAPMIDELARTKPTLGRPIVTGFSQGGMLSFALAIHYPHHVSLAIPVGGWLPPPLWPKQAASTAIYPPIISLHGTADQAVNFTATQEAVLHLQQFGYPSQLIAYPDVNHTITVDMKQKLWTLLDDHLAGILQQHTPHATKERNGPPQR